jgi:CBS domain-containing protein
MEVAMSSVSAVTGSRGLRLSELVGRPVTAPDGQRLGKIKDAVVGLSPQFGTAPPLIGVVVTVGGSEVFVHVHDVADLAADPVVLSTARVDLRPFERREGEILLKHDLLGHRLIDVPDVRLVWARDVQLVDQDGWALIGIHESARRVLGRFFTGGGDLGLHPWSDFDPLIGHDPSAAVRAPFSRLRRLRPAQIADLIEEASHREGEEILETVAGDKELEAEVFEELEPDSQVQMLRDRTDAEIAEVLSRMGIDDAADVLTKLPQQRRSPVLEALPATSRTKIRQLLGFHVDSAGGLMTPDLMALPSSSTVGDAIERVRRATTISEEVLLTVYVVDGDQLVGVISLPALLQADPAALLGQAADPDPVRVSSDAHITEVAVRMTDFNLVTLPVVDDHGHLVGVITVDDVLEATVPEEWWDRVEDVEDTTRSSRKTRRAKPAKG